MIGTEAFTTYRSGVPSMALSVGGPSYRTSSCARRLIVAVCGISLAITASRACGVPGTDASTSPFGWLSGMRAKSGGSRSPLTNCQGPCSDGARNQRPESST